MIVLGIETSCDETAVAVVEDGKRLLSNVVLSSMDLHTVYGGVVPEIAARSHIEAILTVVDQALKQVFGKQETGIRNQERNNERQLVRPLAGTTKDGLKSEIRNTKRVTSPSTTYQPPSTFFDPWSKIDAIAVVNGAGLGGSLLVGVMTARTLAIAKDKPLYAVNHVESHVYANFITEVGVDVSKVQSPKSKVARHSTFDIRHLTAQHDLLHGKTYSLPSSAPKFPMLALIVSGGHSQLVLFRDHFDYTLLGRTRDDAVGEAFDKVAKIVGLPYPGGPSIAQAAKKGDPYKYQLPKAQLEGENTALVALRNQKSEPAKSETNSKSEPRNQKRAVASPSTIYHLPITNYDFSFSGLKTAVLRLAQKEVGEDFTFPSHKLPQRLSETQKNDIVASFQRIAIETLVDKTVLAFEEFQPKSVVIAGGVAASQELRRQLEARLQEVLDKKQKSEAPKTETNPKSEKRNTKKVTDILQYPDMKLCTDNGAMVATLGCFKASLGQDTADPYTLDINPNLSM